MDDYLEQLRERLAANSPEIGRISGQRVLCSSGERIARPLSPEEMREAEARLAERETERQKQWEQWFAAGASGSPPEPEIVSHPAPAPKPKKELPPVEEGRVSELRQKISGNGAPWNEQRAKEIADDLERQIGQIDARLTLTLAGGRRIDWNNFGEVSALLAGRGIGRETGIESFADCWKLDLRLRSIFERWFLSESLALGQALSRSASAGRIADLLLISALSPDYRFGDLATRCLCEHWLEAIGPSDPHVLLALEWRQALPSLAAWLSDDRYLMNAIRSDRLYEPLAGLRGQGSLAPQSYAVMAWLHGSLTGPSVHEFLGQNFGFAGEPDLLEDQMRALNYESSLASVETANGWSRFLSAKRAEFTTELEMSDYDVQFQKAWGGAKRDGMKRFRQARFAEHVELFLGEVRGRALAILAGTLVEQLPNKCKVVAVIRDSVLFEAPSTEAAQRLAPELQRIATEALLRSFSGIIAKVRASVGHSWGEARGLANTLAPTAKND
jgi:hypothetical protein